MTRGLIARPSDSSGSLSKDTSQPYFIIVGESNAFDNQTVYKVGHVSGWRIGTVYETCVTFNLTGLPGYFRHVLCANNSTNLNQDGDSGGPVFLPFHGPYVYLSGTTNGKPDGTTYTNYSTISQIQLDYGNSLGVTRVATLTTPSVSGTIPGGAPTLSWGTVSGASAYHVYKQNDGSGPFTYHGETSSLSYADGMTPAVSVHSSPPSPPYAAYYVRAQGGSQISANSNVVYFKKQLISVVLQGSSAVRPSELCYWTAVPTGGSGSYTYEWKVNGAGSFPNSSQFSYSSASSYTLSVMVTDGSSIPGTQQLNISVSSGNPSCQF